MQFYHYHILDYYCAHRFLTRKKTVHFKLSGDNNDDAALAPIPRNSNTKFPLNRQDFEPTTQGPIRIKSILKKY